MDARPNCKPPRFVGIFAKQQRQRLVQGGVALGVFNGVTNQSLVGLSPFFHDIDELRHVSFYILIGQLTSS